MNRDLLTAKERLAGHSIALCRGEEVLTSDARGVAPMVGYLAEKRDLSGFSVADRVVGKAAAMLFVLAGIKEVYAETLSVSAEEYLTAHGIPVSCGTLTDYIENRTKTGLCPMETAVKDLSDAAEGFAAIQKRIEELRRGNA